MAKIRRNEKCPCGSGKKFKHCCLRGQQRQDAARVPMDRVPELLDWLADFMGQTWLTKQLHLFAQYQSAHTRVLTVPDFHPLVPGLADRAALPPTASPSEPLLLSPAAIRAASHAYDLQLVGHYIPAALRSPKLVSRLRSRGDAISLLFELAVGAHYLLVGCDLRLPELTGDSNVDVVVSWGATEVEIQCKRKAEGSGRKVPNQLFRRLAVMITDTWRAADGEFVIVLECADRLTKSDLSTIAAEINGRLAAGWQGARHIKAAAYTLLMDRRGSAGHKVPGELLRKELEPFFHNPTYPPHVAMIDQLPIQLLEPSAPVSPAYFLCRSRQQDTVLDNVMESFREGARQLNGTKPGVVAVHVPEPITQETLDRMSMPTALGNALNREFEDRARSLSKAAAVVLSGENLWPFHGGEWWSGFPGIMFRNHSARLPLPRGYPSLGKPPSTGDPPR
jgi:hypothetical protein